MNYGYEHTNGKDEQLAAAINVFLDTLPPDKDGRRSAYVEVGGMYPGVRIRKITDYDKDTINLIIKTCDRIFERIVMGRKRKRSREAAQSGAKPHNGGDTV